MSDKFAAYCPKCGATIRFRVEPELGERIVCGECDEKLEVVSLNPLELDWVYEDEDADWGD